MPSCTRAGAFGIARTTRAPSARCPSMNCVVVPAATESSVCSPVSEAEISASTTPMSCGLTETITSPAPFTAAALSLVPSTPKRSRRSASRSGAAARDDELAGRAPVRAEDPADERLAEPPGTEDRDAPARGLRRQRVAARRPVAGSVISHSRPNRRIARMIGKSARPLSVSSYSTRGGDSG